MTRRDPSGRRSRGSRSSARNHTRLRADGRRLRPARGAKRDRHPERRSCGRGGRRRGSACPRRRRRSNPRRPSAGAKSAPRPRARVAARPRSAALPARPAAHRRAIRRRAGCPPGPMPNDGVGASCRDLLCPPCLRLPSASHPDRLDRGSPPGRLAIIPRIHSPERGTPPDCRSPRPRHTPTPRDAHPARPTRAKAPPARPARARRRPRDSGSERG